MLLEVSNLRSGAILDYHDGTETDDYLEIQVNGIADPEATVRVDGIPARRLDKNFFGKAFLRSKINQVAITSSSQYGELTYVLTLVWDKKAFKRYNFYIDDHSFFFTDLAKERPRRAFEHFYLAALKSIHEKYGTVMTLNCFYHNHYFPFDMKDMPDCYRSEFEDNADWLRFSWHAYSEFPDRPYQHADAATVARDYDLVHDEILRFAGEKSFIPPVGVHWGMVNPDVFPVLRQRGVRVLDGEYLCGKVSLEEKETQSRVADVGYFYEKDVTEYVWNRKVFYDRFSGLMLCHCDLTVNMVPLAQIRSEVEKAVNHPYYRTLLELSSHEQYSFPYYFNYLPDHLQRLDEACHAASDAGYRPVFFAEGLFGNQIWEK